MPETAEEELPPYPPFIEGSVVRRNGMVTPFVAKRKFRKDDEGNVIYLARIPEGHFDAGMTPPFASINVATVPGKAGVQFQFGKPAVTWWWIALGVVLVFAASVLNTHVLNLVDADWLTRLAEPFVIGTILGSLFIAWMHWPVERRKKRRAREEESE